MNIFILIFVYFFKIYITVGIYISRVIKTIILAAPFLAMFVWPGREFVFESDDGPFTLTLIGANYHNSFTSFDFTHLAAVGLYIFGNRADHIAKFWRKCIPERYCKVMLAYKTFHFTENTYDGGYSCGVISHCVIDFDIVDKKITYQNATVALKLPTLRSDAESEYRLVAL